MCILLFNVQQIDVASRQREARHEYHENQERLKHLSALLAKHESDGVMGLVTGT